MAQGMFFYCLVLESQKNFVTMFSSISLKKIFFGETKKFCVFYAFGPRRSFYKKSSGVLRTKL